MSKGTKETPRSPERFLRNSSDSLFQAAACTLAVLVKTPSRSNRTASWSRGKSVQDGVEAPADEFTV
jgi:hypothetical protein